MATEISESTHITCAETDETREVRRIRDGSPALPPGWKRMADGRCYSPDGVRRRFALRTLRFPVASVENFADFGDLREGWRALRSALRTNWEHTTAAANTLITEYALCDREPAKRGKDGKWKLEKFRPDDKALYHLVRTRFPELDSQSVGSLRQRVRKKYQEKRFDVKRGAASLPTYRYPVPLPIPAKDAPASVDERRKPFVSLRLSGRRFHLRLRGGSAMRRQIDGLVSALEAGRIGEVSVYEQASGGSHRPGGSARPRGNNRRPTRVMVALTALIPKTPAAKEDRTLYVRTGADRLWTATLAGRDHTWDLHERQVVRRAAAHRRELARIADDRKWERRAPADQRSMLNDRLEVLTRRHHRYLNDSAHKASAMLAGFARRQRVARVVYRESGRFIEDYPFFKLRSLCEQKLAESGITFEVREDSGGEGDGSVRESAATD